MFGKKNEKIIDFRTKDQKKFEFQMKVKRGWDSTANFVRNNLDVLAVIVPAGITVIGGGSKILSSAIRAHTVDKELKDQERRIYDHSLGRYSYLKRPLRANEALIIEERRNNGEKLNMILQDMNLLKK